MGQMPTWQVILIGLVMVGLVLWFRPGIKRAFAQSRKASRADWLGVALPVGAVVLFIVLVILMARSG